VVKNGSQWKESYHNHAPCSEGTTKTHPFLLVYQLEERSKNYLAVKLIPPAQPTIIQKCSFFKLWMAGLVVPFGSSDSSRISPAKSQKFL